MARTVSAHIEEWPFRAPFKIAGHVFKSCKLLLVEIKDGTATGRGESCGVYYLEDTPETALDEVEKICADLRNGADRSTLLNLLPPGGARNAVDCALWDLECKLSGRSIWEITGLSPTPKLTAYTIGILPEPEDVARKAASIPNAKLLKIKLDQVRPIDRVKAVRAARPDARIIVDANQALSFDQLEECLTIFKECGVEMVEQPLPRGRDHILASYVSCIPLCADESCRDRSELADVTNKYQVVNIKLDKTGGLTEALALATEIKQAGLDVMIGNMSGTSLAAAPGFVIAQLCKYVDLDGPFGLRADRVERMQYSDCVISEPVDRFWGGY